KPRRASEDLLDQVDGPVGADYATADGEELVQKRVRRRRGLEAWQRPEVGGAGSGVVANAFERHVDERPIVGLERDAEIELEDAVRALDRPVVAAGEDLAAEALSLERAAGDGERDPRSMRRGADVLGRRSAQTELEERSSAHGMAPFAE